MNSWRTSRSVSFKNAFAGIWFNLRKEPNFRIQLIFALLVIMAGIFLSITRNEWIVVILSIGAVLSTEAINTAIEKICDRFLDKEDSSVKIIKDSAAAAVLITSIVAIVIGIVVFWPYVVEFIKDL
jgi:undecaprenol kinase